VVDSTRFLGAFNFNPFVLRHMALHFSDINHLHRSQAEKEGGIA
jgi:hypothetical protein